MEERQIISKKQGEGDILQITALTEDGLEPVTDLAATDREVLFVLADTLKEEDVNALAAYKERLRGAGGRPFFIRSCHRHSKNAGPAGML